MQIQANTRSAIAEDGDGEIIDETENHKFVIYKLGYDSMSIT